MKNFVFVSVCLLFIVFGFSSCELFYPSHECENTVIDTVTVGIEEIDKYMVPYKGYDTLKFLRSPMGDTITLYGKGMVTDWGITDIDDYVDGCPKDKALMERVRYTFKDASFNTEVEVTLTYRRYGGPAYIYIFISPHSFHTSAGSLGSRPYNYDSLQIVGSMYYNVNKIAEPNAGVYFILYNIRYGILKVQFQNGDTWEKLPN